MIHEVTEHQLPIKIIDNKDWKSQSQPSDDEEDQVVIATDDSIPFQSFGTEPWKHDDHQGRSVPGELMSRYSECVGLHQKLSARYKTCMKLLLESRYYFLVLRKFTDCENAVKSCLECMNKFDFEDDVQIVERRSNQAADRVVKAGKLHQDLLNEFGGSPESHHRSFELFSMKEKAHSMIQDLRERHSAFNMDFQKHHGCCILASSYAKTQSDIAKLKNRVTRNPYCANLNVIRLAQREYQQNKRSIETLNIFIQKLSVEFKDLTKTIGEKCLEPSLVSLKEYVLKEMVSLEEASEEKGKNLSSLYGIHGYMADAEELVAGLEEYDVFLNGFDVPESLEEVQQKQDLLQQLRDEFSHKMQIASDLVHHGKSIEKSMTSEVKTVHQTLSGNFKAMLELQDIKTTQLNKKKQKIVSENNISKITKDLEDIQEAITDLDLQRDTLGVSYSDLMKECERLNGLLVLQQQRYGNVESVHVDGSGGNVEAIIKEVGRSLEELKESGFELLTFEQFMMKSGSLLESMRNVVNRLSDCDSKIGAKNLKRRIKSVETTRMFIKSLDPLKNELYEKGCGFLEDCHFASMQISDELENVDAVWQELVSALYESDRKVESLSKQNELRAQYHELNDAQKRIEKRLTNETRIDSLSTAKKFLNNSKLLEKEIDSKIRQIEDLLKSCGPIDEDMLRSTEQLLCDLEHSKQRCLESQRDRENLCNYHSFLIQAHLEESWLKEKFSLLGNLAAPKSVTEAFSISKSLEMSRHQIARHRRVVQNIISSGEFCLNNDSKNGEEIEGKIMSLNTLSQQVDQLLDEKTLWIDCQLKFLQYTCEGENHLEYIDTKLAIIMQCEYGNDLNSAEIAIQKHQKFKEELLSYKEHLKVYVKEANHLSSSPEVKLLAQSVKNRYKKLEQYSNYRDKMLRDSQQLFTLLSEADSLRSSMVDFSKTIPEDQNSGTQDEAVLHNGRLAIAMQKMASIHKAYVDFQQHCARMNKLPHEANIAKVKGKIDGVYNKITERLNSRMRKSNKLLQYFDFTNSLSNTAERSDELHKCAKVFHRKARELSTIPALKEELRQCGHTLNESKIVKTEIKDLVDKLSKLTEEFPGKSIQKFAQHLKLLKLRYTECTKMLKDSQSLLQTKISDLSFKDDVAHLDGWLSHTSDEMDVVVEGALDFTSASLSHSQVEMKCKEIELKRKLLDKLSQSTAATSNTFNNLNQSTAATSNTSNKDDKVCDFF